MDDSEICARASAEVDAVKREAQQEAKAPPAGGGDVPVQVSDTETSDAYLRLIFDAAAMGIALVDVDGRPILSNPALARIMGYGEDELGRMAFPKFTHPEDVALDAELFRELVAEKRTHYQIERRYVRKDGSIVSARLTVSLVPGGSRRVIAMVEDISAEHEARARAAATLRSLEDRVAELAAIHDLSAVLRDPGRPIGDVLTDVARTLHAASRAPSAWGVRVTLGDVIAEAGGFADTACTASAAFGPSAEPRGRIEAFRAGASARSAPPIRGHPEQQLLQTVADHLGAALERRRVDEALRESERDARHRSEELQAVLDAVPVAVCMSRDPLVRKLLSNRTAFTLLGLPVPHAALGEMGTADILRMGRLSLGGRSFGVEELPLLVELASDANVHGLVGEFQTPDGRQVQVTGDLAAMRDSSGAMTGIVAAFLDVTPQAKMLREVELLRRAIEQSPASVVITDAHGDIEYVNPRSCELSGYSAAELIGRNPRILSSGQLPQQVYREMWSQLLAGREWCGEFRNRRKDGTPFSERATISPITDKTGKITHYVAVKEDLTSLRKAEGALELATRQLVQAQKMEALGRLAGGVAHDFNNLLCVILGYGQLALQVLQPTHPVTPMVEQVVKAGHGAEALTHQLLAFSRRQVLQPRVLDVNRVIRRSERMLQRLIGEDVTLVVDLAVEPAVVRVSAGHVEQVLMNLVVNARDAMPNGGRLTIRTAFERGGGRWGTPEAEIPVGPWVVLSVADTGTGMDATTQARVFEPFFTTKALGIGTGLGLATVQVIVSQSGGQVAFVSAPDQGTEFRVHLPRLSLDAEDEDRAPIDLSSCGGKETVLVAEDQEAVRQLIRTWLERRGYRVLEAVDGKDGVEVAAAHEGAPDLLITDVVMPRAGGQELASALRSRDPALPVIYISGYTSSAMEQRGALGPGFRLLDKPLSEATLLRAVREALDETRQARGGAEARPPQP